MTAAKYPAWTRRELLQALTQEDNRFRVTFGAENRGIAGNTNAALTMATGEFVALCDHDDLLDRMRFAASLKQRRTVRTSFIPMRTRCPPMARTSLSRT